MHLFLQNRQQQVEPCPSTHLESRIQSSVFHISLCDIIANKITSIASMDIPVNTTILHYLYVN